MGGGGGGVRVEDVFFCASDALWNAAWIPCLVYFLWDGQCMPGMGGVTFRSTIPAITVLYHIVPHCLPPFAAAAEVTTTVINNSASSSRKGGYIHDANQL